MSEKCLSDSVIYDKSMFGKKKNNMRKEKSESLREDKRTFLVYTGNAALI